MKQKLLLTITLCLTLLGSAWAQEIPLAVTITRTDGAQTTVTNAASLKDAIGTIPLGEVQKLEISAGSFTFYDWTWLQVNRVNLNNLTHFIITDGVAAVADMPGTYPSTTIFGTQLQVLKVAKMVDVGDYVLCGCTSLTTLELPQVTRIKKEAFRGCTSLTNLNLPKILQVYAGAFRGCASLSSVSLPMAFSIEGEAFLDCAHITNLMLRATPPATSASAFKGCPTSRHLVFADADGIRFTGEALENARAAYKAVDDGNTSDNLWYGWDVSRNLYVPRIDPAMVNGSLTAGNPEAILFGGYPAGATVFIAAAPSAGYKLTPGSLRAYKTGDESTVVPITGNSFIMPDFEVTVTGEFELLPLQATFVASNSGTFPVSILLGAGNTSVSVDNGDGVLVAYDIDPEFSVFYVISYLAGNTVKIYGENITALGFQCALTALDVSRVTKLTLLYCPNSLLNFATLPQPKASYEMYVYAPQADMPAICTNGVVDLSSQLTAIDKEGNTQATKYKWYLTDGTSLTANLDYVENGGVFTFVKIPVMDVYCEMTNAAFPDLILRTEPLTVKIATAVRDEEAVIVSLFPNPFHDYVEIGEDAGKIRRVSFVNLAGQTMLVEEAPTGRIHVASLKPGIYLVKVEDNDGKTTVLRLVKH